MPWKTTPQVVCSSAIRFRPMRHNPLTANASPFLTFASISNAPAIGRFPELCRCCHFPQSLNTKKNTHPGLHQTAKAQPLAPSRQGNCCACKWILWRLLLLRCVPAHFFAQSEGARASNFDGSPLLPLLAYFLRLCWRRRRRPPTDAHTI